MTIDEFMRDIAPKMKAGYIYQDEHGTWWFDENKPDIICQFGETTPYSWEFQDTRENISFYGLQQVSNWTESLREIKHG